LKTVLVVDARRWATDLAMNAALLPMHSAVRSPTDSLHCRWRRKAKDLFSKILESWRNLDYTAGWFFKAADTPP
jgi:hypothetical protein